MEDDYSLDPVEQYILMVYRLLVAKYAEKLRSGELSLEETRNSVRANLEQRFSYNEQVVFFQTVMMSDIIADTTNTTTEG